MSAYVRRVINDREHWLGRSRVFQGNASGFWQWTPDKASRTRFESRHAADKAVADLVKQVVGVPEVVTE